MNKSIFVRISFSFFQVYFPDAYVQVDGSRVQLNEVKKLPGLKYTIRIKAPQGTLLGLLSVDQSVYLLRNKNSLTEERVSTKA